MRVDQSAAAAPASLLRYEDVERLVRHVSALILGRLQRLGLLDANARLDPDAGY